MSILTASRLAKLAQYPLLESSWYYVAAATLSVCNRPDEIPVLYKYVLEQNHDEKRQAVITSQIREALLKGAALAGLPKTINSLSKLKEATPQHLRQSEPLRTEVTSDVGSRDIGASFFDQVYGKISKRVIGNLRTSYPDLAQYTINHVYGPLLSYTGVLGPKETSLVVVACLIPQDVNPQLKGHLKGALNNGASVEEVMSVRQMSIDICDWCGVTWNNPVAKL